MPEVTQKDELIDSIPRFIIPKEELKPAEAPPEPEPPVADAATPEPPAQPPEAPEATDSAPEKPDRREARRFERRIHQAREAAREAEARAERAIRELESLKSGNKPSEPLNTPKLENFSDVGEYEKAVAEFHRQEVRKELEAESRKRAQEQAQQSLASNWREMSDRGASKYEDFDEVVGDLKPTTPWAMAIMNADNGEEIAYYLGTHEKEVKRIMGLNPAQQFLEIGRLSHRLTLKPEAPKTPPKAPPPITPVSGAAEGTGDEIRPGMSPEEYMKIGRKMFGGY